MWEANDDVITSTTLTLNPRFVTDRDFDADLLYASFPHAILFKLRRRYISLFKGWKRRYRKILLGVESDTRKPEKNVEDYYWLARHFRISALIRDLHIRGITARTTSFSAPIRAFYEHYRDAYRAPARK